MKLWVCKGNLANLFEYYNTTILPASSFTAASGSAKRERVQNVHVGFWATGISHHISSHRRVDDFPFGVSWIVGHIGWPFILSPRELKVEFGLVVSPGSELHLAFQRGPVVAMLTATDTESDGDDEHHTSITQHNDIGMHCFLDFMTAKDKIIIIIIIKTKQKTTTTNKPLKNHHTI